MAQDAITLLTEDHRKVESLFVRFESTRDPQEQTEIVHEVIHELAVHGEIEELIFYPALRNALPEGDSLADEAVQEHVEIKQTLNDLDKMTAEHDQFATKMRELMAEVRHHVEEEENEIFPRIVVSLEPEKLEEMGEALSGARRLVPSRPHPNAPTSPLGKLVAGAPALALVDRVRDAVRGFADKRAGS